MKTDEHGTDIVENEAEEAVTVEDFDNVFIEDPEPDPEPDPDKGNEDGGNEDEGDTDDGKKEPDTQEGEESSLDINDDTRLEIDGEPVLLKELKAAYKNNKDFIASNTQKAQEVADQRKALDKEILAAQSFSGINNLLKSNPEVVNSLKDHFKDNPDALKTIDNAMKANPDLSVNPYEKQIEELKNQISFQEAEISFKQEMHDCKIKHELKDDDMKEIETIILDEHRDSGANLSFEKAWKMWQADKIIEQQQNNKPKPPESQKGKVRVNTSRNIKENKGAYGKDYSATEKDFENIFDN